MRKTTDVYEGIKLRPNEKLWPTFLPVDLAVWGMMEAWVTELQELPCLSGA